jgi:hypothetical protein
MSSSLTVGMTATLTFTVTNSAGALADPTDLSVEVTTPQGVATTYTYSGGGLTRASLGVFKRANYVLTRSGRYYCEMDATGAVIANGDFEFFVHP